MNEHWINLSSHFKNRTVTLPGHEIWASRSDKGGFDETSVSTAKMYSKSAISQPFAFSGCIDTYD